MSEMSDFFVANNVKMRARKRASDERNELRSRKCKYCKHARWFTARQNSEKFDHQVGEHRLPEFEQTYYADYLGVCLADVDIMGITIEDNAYTVGGCDLYARGDE